MNLRPLFLAACAALAAQSPAPRRPAMSFFDLSASTLKGQPQAFSAFKGKVVLAVNVASECGYTPQYEGLEKLYTRFKDKGLVVLGFPCNQFGGQEPGSAAQIEQFCAVKFGVKFPLFEKVDVKGPGQSPVYAFLTAKHGEPKWNFHKYLVGRDGQVIQAYGSAVEPESAELVAAIEAALK
ncbi:MAG TPA: glutathione peroxidase [Holophagaceae bacterium]|nr:glutathione peroxidase [Holophagaceae bacterium]